MTHEQEFYGQTPEREYTEYVVMITGPDGVEHPTGVVSDDADFAWRRYHLWEETYGFTVRMLTRNVTVSADGWKDE